MASATVYGTGGVRVEVHSPPSASAATLRLHGDRVIVLDDTARLDLARALLPTGFAIADETDLL